MRRSCIRAGVLSFAIVGACHSEGDRSSAFRDLAPVEFSGCHRLREGPICEVEAPTELTVWVGSEGPFEVRHGGERIELRWRAVQGGLQARVLVGAGAGSVEVRRGDAVWRLMVEVRPRPEPVRRADALRKQAQLDEAEAILKAANLPASDRDRADLAAVRARIALARGQSATAREFLLEASDRARQAGLTSLAVNERLTAAFLDVLAGRLGAGSQLLNQSEALLTPEDHRGRAAWTYYRGYLRESSGDARSAIVDYRSVEERTERIDVMDVGGAAGQRRALLLASRGFIEPALSLLQRWLQRPDASPCSRAHLLGNRGWVALMAQETGQRVDVDPAGSAERALEIVTTECPDPVTAQSLRLDLALAALQANDADTATRWLAEVDARAEDTAPFVELWRHDVQGRIALATGNVGRALASFEDLVETGRRHDSLSAQWRGRLGEGLAHEQAGKVREALRAYRVAESIVDRITDRVATLEHRGRLSSSMSRSVSRLVRLLVQQRSWPEAIEAIHRAQTRTFRSLATDVRVASLSPEDRDRWLAAVEAYQSLRRQMAELAGDEWGRVSKPEGARRRRELQRQAKAELTEALALPGMVLAQPSRAWDPASSTLHLGWFRGRQEDFAFGVGLGARRVLATHEASTVLAAFDAELDGASQIRVLGGSEDAELDLHAVPWRKRPLLAAKEVVYTLGLRRPEEAEPMPTVRALLVGDPAGDLPGARDEIAIVREALQGWGVEVTVLAGEHAHREAVLRGLRTATLFHYAGHAESSGIGGWESALPLADGTELALADVLALERPPRFVVLLGCGTAAAASRKERTLGLGEAFVLAGSSAVVVTNRSISDRTAKRVARGLYGADVSTLAGALRQASMRLWATDPDADWSAFRVLEP